MLQRDRWFSSLLAIDLIRLTTGMAIEVGNTWRVHSLEFPFAFSALSTILNLTSLEPPDHLQPFVCFFPEFFFVWGLASEVGQQHFDDWSIAVNCPLDIFGRYLMSPGTYTAHCRVTREKTLVQHTCGTVWCISRKLT